MSYTKKEAQENLEDLWRLGYKYQFKTVTHVMQEPLFNPVRFMKQRGLAKGIQGPFSKL